MSFIDRVLTFTTVVELGSFSKAAAHLSITKAAVSKQITQLEAELGAPLLVRSTRSLSLTDSGTLLLEKAFFLKENVEDLENLFSEIRKEPQGRLKICLARHFAYNYVLPYLKEFTEKYPKVEIVLHVEERLPDMEKEKIDLVLGNSLLGSEDITVRRIGEANYVLCASPEYLKREGTPVTRSDLKGHQYISHSMRPHHNVIWGDAKESSFIPKIQVNDIEVMRYLAECGHGLVWMHDYAAKKSLEEGKLLTILPKEKPYKVPLWASYRSVKHLPPKIRAFLDFVIAKVSQ
ncbi:MAG: LysR family transcriptional regulator [Waddliaceae bacterium]|nr:LysR family transcriptional regulator [Waddliaceae bacterium]